eukprot:g2399.t1
MSSRRTRTRSNELALVSDFDEVDLAESSQTDQHSYEPPNPEKVLQNQNVSISTAESPVELVRSVSFTRRKGTGRRTRRAVPFASKKRQHRRVKSLDGNNYKGPNGRPLALSASPKRRFKRNETTNRKDSHDLSIDSWYGKSFATEDVNINFRSNEFDENINVENNVLSPVVDGEADVKKMWLTSTFVKRPCLSVLVLLVPIVLLSLGGFFSGIEIDVSLDAFKVDHRHFSVSRYESYKYAGAVAKETKKARESALTENHGNNGGWRDRDRYLLMSPSMNDTTSIEFDYETQVDTALKTHDHIFERRKLGVWYKLGRLDVVYLPKAKKLNGNVMSAEFFRAAHEIELDVMRAHDYEKFCFGGPGLFSNNMRKTYKDCHSPSSILTYFFPSANLVTGKLEFNGFGSTMLPFDSMLALASQNPKAYFFLSQNGTFIGKYSYFLRSSILFATQERPGTAKHDETIKRFKEFSMRYPTYFKSLNDPLVDVVYGSDGITKQEVKRIVIEDSFFALGSLLFIIFYSSFHMGSFFLGFVGVIQVLLTLPISIFICKLLEGDFKLGIMNGLSIYIILGIGVDDLFVFIDFFKQEQYIIDMEKRMAQTYRRAARAMFITSFTTAVAYVSNFFTLIPVIRFFVLMMAILVFVNYILVITFFPAVVSLWWTKIRHAERAIFRCFLESCSKDTAYNRWMSCFTFVFLFGWLRSLSTCIYNSICSCCRLWKKSTMHRIRSTSSADFTSLTVMNEDEQGNFTNSVELSNRGRSSIPRNATVPLSMATETANATTTETESNFQQEIDSEFLSLTTEKKQPESKMISLATNIFAGSRIRAIVSIILSITLIILFCINTTNIKAATDLPQLFRKTHNIQRYWEIQMDFAGDHRCDFCAAENDESFKKKFGHCYTGKCGNGTCNNANGHCTCLPGWEGDACDAKQSSQCIGGCGHGECDVNQNHCVCEKGWRGARCDEELDLCSNINCGEHGTCKTGKCVCSDGYRGSLCQYLPGSCIGVHCGDNGICVAGSCTCNKGFIFDSSIYNSDSGKDPCIRESEVSANPSLICSCRNERSEATLSPTCAKNVVTMCTSAPFQMRPFCNCIFPNGLLLPKAKNLLPCVGLAAALIPKVCTCDKINCGAHGTCTNGSCICKDRYSGDFCEIAPASACTGVECDAHGICREGKCLCSDGYHGEKCELEPSPCLGINCGQHGTCDNSGKCQCGDGYSGENCEIEPGPCYTVDCGENGTCRATSKTAAECDCTNGYSGARCLSPPKSSTGQCENVNCGEHGNCVSGKCVCTNGWSDDLCQTKPPLCFGINCGDHGSCNDGKCVCGNGYSGTNCEVQPSLCYGVECGEHGSCAKESGKCQCTDDYSGERCEIIPDKCKNIDCGDHGNCLGGNCNCDGGYSGTKCLIPPPACFGINCGSHGSCNDGKCICGDGYSGKTCNVEPSRCFSVDCGHGRCEDGVCKCDDGYSGENCSVTSGSASPDQCENVNCGEHGNCVSGKCVCTNGWSDDLCQTKPPLCFGINCGDHGSCNDGKCVCGNGYSGTNCEVQPSLCYGVECGEHGSCAKESGKCQCTDDYSGERCEIIPDKCKNIDCGDHGNCLGGNCNCDGGYSGTKCLIPPPACFGINCGSHGSCNDGKCICANGYNGDRCEVSPSKCYGVSCGLHGSCSEGDCVCSGGFTGKNCEIAPQTCENIDCGIHGNCEKGLCVCNEGYAGDTCNVEVDPCLSVQCAEHGSCVAGLCVCQDGWRGATCNVQPDVCYGVQCGIHGFCNEGNCTCTDGYSGLKCEQPDLCKDIDCGRFGNCDESNGSCVCTDDIHVGERCETDSCADVQCYHGVCRHGRCNCDTNYIGDTCNVDECSGVDCGKHGSCYHGSCVCTDDFSGKNCEKAPVIEPELVCACETASSNNVPLSCRSALSKLCKITPPPGFSGLCSECGAALASMAFSKCTAKVMVKVTEYCPNYVPVVHCTTREEGCSSHGDCIGSTCDCDDFFDGENCQRCTLPQATYPNCTPKVPKKDAPRTVNTHNMGIKIVWGINGIKYGPGMSDAWSGEGIPDVELLWDADFDFSDPEVIVKLADVCDKLLSPKYIDMIQKSSLKCPALDFRDYLKTSSQWPPSRSSVERMFYDFYLNNSNKYDGGQVLFSGEFGLREPSVGERKHVKLYSISLQTPINGHYRSFALMKYFQVWEDFVANEVNANAPSSAGKAYQTSDDWEGMFTEITAVSGTAASVALMAATAFLSVYIFTSSIRVAALMMIGVGGTVVVVLGSFPIFGWPFGIVEAISISILLGSSIDYPLHVAESFIDVTSMIAREKGQYRGIENVSLQNSRRNEEQKEFGRVVSIAMQRIGGAIFNASFTTMVSVCFLFFCQFNVLREVGFLILFSAGVSITFTVSLLVPMLALCGPSTFIRQARTQCFAVCGSFLFVLVSIFILWLFDIHILSYLGF